MSASAMWNKIKQHGPSWLGSLAVHLVILVPLCLISWAVGTAMRPDAVLSLSPVVEGAPDVVGDPGEVDRSREGSKDGAAGSGKDTKAPGALSNAFAALPPGPMNGLLGDIGPTVAPADPSGGGGLHDATNRLISNLTGTGAGTPGRLGRGGLGFGIAGLDRGFADEIKKTRETGLDVVLVIDATDSMSPYINQAKQRLKDIVLVVEGLVPLANIGMVAYKDYGDDYGPTAVKSLKISHDHKAVKDFLDGVVAGGGGDEPEPIDQALKVATDVKMMGWENGRKWVIILIGDSTIHPSGRDTAFQLAAHFAADFHGTINVIDVGGSGAQGARRAQVQPDLQRVAKDGGGSAFLLVDEHAFWQCLIGSIFGQRYQSDIDAIIKKYVIDPQIAPTTDVGK